ncbi:hypothetical protein O181_035447 [Austropuccinia psidii MF-1]|uniref:Uncharacterized protein n=1 Tax=Austropuccinia psidii MF-1 TaxID=1389203 RepID=A0A9Q3H905_9BASI|nr:hypothetical protein [Austropuccinia psidii MF-1]
MKPQPQGHVLDNPYHQEDIKAYALLVNKARSPSQYQDGGNMSYCEKEAFKKFPEASSWPKFSGIGENDYMELIDYINRLFIDVPRMQYYWITAILNTEFKGNAYILYTEMKEIHGRGSWPWWKSQIIQKHCNDPYKWCLRKLKRLQAIGPQINIQMGKHKLLMQMPGELDHAVKFRHNQSFTLYDIANPLQDLRKRTKVGKNSQFKSTSFKEKQPLRVDYKENPKEKILEVTKKKNTCHNCG